MRVSCLLLHAALLGAAEAIVSRSTQLDTENLLKELALDQKNVSSTTERDLYVKYKGEFKITGDYSMDFMKCVSLKMEPDDSMFTQQTYDLTQSGYIVKQKSYVLLDLCKTGDCGTRYAGHNLYIAPLETYMKAVIPASKGPDKQTICGLCAEYCPQDDSVSYGGRRDKIVYIDCGNCEEKGCYDDLTDDETGDGGLTKAETWATEIAGCTSLNQQYLGAELYASFMCNARGNGVDIGVFLDEECTVYTNLKSVLSILEENQEDDNIYQAYWPIVYPFSEPIECGISVYYPPQAYAAGYKGAGENYGINDMCTEIFAEGVSYPLNTCGTNVTKFENDTEVKVKEITHEEFKFYKYILSYEDSLDNQAVCQTVQDLSGRYCAASTYVDKWSGKFFEYKNGKGSRKCRLSGSPLKMFKPMAKFFGRLILGLGAVMAAVMLGSIVYERAMKRNRRGKKLISPASPAVPSNGQMA